MNYYYHFGHTLSTKKQSREIRHGLFTKTKWNHDSC